MVSVSLTFIVRAYEKKSFFDALARSFKLVQGKWWSTFGLIMILYFVMMTISYVFIIPWYAVTYDISFPQHNNRHLSGTQYNVGIDDHCFLHIVLYGPNGPRFLAQHWNCISILQPC